MIQNGSSVLVFDANGAPIACQRNVDVTFNDDLIDVTCKQSNGYSEFLAGKRSFSMTCEALTDWGQNLLLYSEEIENAYWSSFQAAANTSTELSPNLDSFANEIVYTDSGGVIFKTTAININGSYTFSIFAKYDNQPQIRVGFTDGVDYETIVNIQTGEIISTSAGITSSIENAANGYYRISITRTSTTSNTLGVYFGFVGTNNGIFYAWGAQLNTGTTAQSYYQTTNTVNPNIDTLVSANLNRTKVELNIANPAFDDIYFNGEAYVESIELNAGTETEASYTVTFSGTGDLVSLVS